MKKLSIELHRDIAERAAAIERGLIAVTEWERSHGTLTAEELAAADAELDAPRPARRRR